MNFYLINEEYLNFLRETDEKVMRGSSFYKEDKFTLGVVFKINSICYYAPVSSIKEYQLKDKVNLKKECKKTCFPIMGDRFGNEEILSTVRLDFMFPVPESEIQTLIINNIKNSSRNLIRKELNYILKNELVILKKAEEIYNKAVKPTHYLHNKCCDFKKLEVKYNEWIIKQNK